MSNSQEMQDISSNKKRVVGVGDQVLRSTRSPSPSDNVHGGFPLHILRLGGGGVYHLATAVICLWLKMRNISCVYVRYLMMMLKLVNLVLIMW